MSKLGKRLIKAAKEGRDIVERLRKYTISTSQGNGTPLLILEAADEIERLRDLLVWNGIDPDARIESAKGAALARRDRK